MFMANSPEEKEPLKNMVRAALSDGNLSDWLSMTEESGPCIFA